MLYYVYVSDTKLDMLSSQIPPKIRDSIAAELKIDLKLLSLTVKSRDSEETRYSKLSLVTKYLREHQDVGSVDVPGQYFEGSLPMVWGPIGEGRGIYFGTITEHTILGLAGSPRHVIRPESAGSVPSEATSAAPDLYELLRSTSPTAVEAAPITLSGLVLGLDSEVTKGIMRATTGSRGPVQRLEFLAKRVADGTTDLILDYEGDRKRVVLGTPVYVAQVD